MHRSLTMGLPVILVIGGPSCYRDGKPMGPAGALSAEGLQQFLSEQASPRPPEFMVGKADKDLHPALTHPRYLAWKEADSFLRPDDRVSFIRADGMTLVYPELILGLHHVVNETLSKVPIAVTDCLLSDSALLYDRRLGPRTLRFGALGTTYFGNLVLYDQESDSCWLQLTGEAIKGDLKGKKLALARTLEKTTWDRVKHMKDVNVLAPQGPVENYRSFLENSRAGKLGLELLQQVKEPDSRLPLYTEGLGIAVRETPRFYPLEKIRDLGLIEDELGGWTLLILYDPAFDSSRIFRRYVDGRRLTFGRQGDLLRDEETSSEWTLSGHCVRGKLRGKQLDIPAYTQAYWFSWAAFYPSSDIFSAR